MLLRFGGPLGVVRSLPGLLLVQSAFLEGWFGAGETFAEQWFRSLPSLVGCPVCRLYFHPTSGSERHLVVGSGSVGGQLDTVIPGLTR